MADKVQRFIAGDIDKCYLATPRKFTSKTNGNTWESYGLHIVGAFEDTGDLVDNYFNSNYTVRVYEGGEEPIDPHETDNLKFKGRILVNQIEDRFYLQAVSIEQRVGQEEDTIQGNPFLENPLN